MPKVTIKTEISIEVSDASDELLKVAGREIIAGIASSVDHNQNIEDITVTSIESLEVIEKKTNLMPELPDLQ